VYIAGAGFLQTECSIYLLIIIQNEIFYKNEAYFKVLNIAEMFM